ncbi:MAG TPA: cell division protein CrgA [Actinomycetota bacterium]|nr:cell division protein CrgA [Actinomycetota bacterium]
MPKSRSKRVQRQPPPRPKPKQSPPWVGAPFFILIGAGFMIIISHYLGVLPGGTQPYQLWVGLGLITVSFLVATQWH